MIRLHTITRERDGLTDLTDLTDLKNGAMIPERIALKDDVTNDEFDVSLENISKHCKLAWALCDPKVQGCTEQGTVLLHDVGSSKYLRRCHLYFGLSRVTDGNNVFIARD